MSAGMPEAHLYIKQWLISYPDTNVHQHLGMAANFDDHPMDIGEYNGDDGSFGTFTTLDDTGGSNFADTVSPNDLTYSHDDFSRPPHSNSFTNLTTPSLLDDESPYLHDSLDVSPAFEAGDFGRAAYTPLFPTDEFKPAAPTAAAHKRRTLADSEAGALVDGLGRRSHGMSRTASNRSLNEDVSNRHELLRQRLSMTAGIAKSTRRQPKILSPIEVDEGDERAIKRAKNTMAARKSRQKKKDEVTQLEAQLIEMMDERDYWKMLAIKHGAPIPDSPSPSVMSPGS